MSLCLHVRWRQLVAPLDIDAIHKAEKEAKRTKVFLLRNAGLPICPRRLPYMSNLREVDLSSNRIVEMPFDIGELHKVFCVGALCVS